MDKIYAIIAADNTAVNFVRWDGIKPFNYGAEAGHKLVLLPDQENYAHGWLWDGRNLLPPAPALDLATIKARARARVIQYADAITARITSLYPAAEVASWPTREMEAMALSANGSAPAPLLRAIAAMTGQNLAALAQSVLGKAAAYRQVVAAVEAVRTEADAGLAKADTPEKVDAVLAALKARADALAGQMGLA